MINLEKRRINQTGMSLSPELAREMIDGAQASEPSSKGSAEDLAMMRLSYAKKAEPAGSVPPPRPDAALPSKLAAPEMLFMDKIGERLAFERAGVRLYDALLSKYDAYGSWAGGPKRAELEELRNEELQHFLMLNQIMLELGGDSTAVTPSANLHAVASKGIPAVLTDPRTNLQECMEAMLIVELSDNDCWFNLANLAIALGKFDVAGEFERALRQEDEHLVRVRAWIGAALSKGLNGKSALLQGQNNPTARMSIAEAPATNGKPAQAKARTKSTPRSARPSKPNGQKRSASRAKSASRSKAGRARNKRSR